MKQKRIDQMIEYIKKMGNVSLKELKDKFNISLNTVRRDINELSEANIVQKVYGGVIYNQERNFTQSYEDRNISFSAEKQKIGKLASEYIKQHDIVYVDSGTTTHFILDNLSEALELTLISNSLEVMNKAATFPNINLIAVGETFKRSTKSFTGLSDDQSIGKYNINKAFMSATAFSVENGASNSDLLENRIKYLVSNKATEVYLLVDSSKFGKTSLYTYCRPEDLQAILTDNNLDTEYSELLKNSTEVISTN